MQVFDEKFLSHKGRVVLQCLLATCAVFLVLLVLDAKSNAAIITALGASAFIVFAMPEAQASRPRFLIGGYLAGIAAGVACHALSPWLLPHFLGRAFISYAVLGAMSVGLPMFLMVITDTEHPPAAGLALALLLNEWTPVTLLVVMAGVLSLSAMRVVLRPVLRDLL